METEQRVAAEYGCGGILRAIVEALAASGKDVERLSTADLSRLDEFHLGWRPATEELARALGLAPGMRLLDVGCGIGGPCRFFAETRGCRVEGIDLTEEYVEVARDLTRRCGLQDAVSFRQASALALPFAPDTFDAATLIHVGMNIADKRALFTEIRRVLKAGAAFGVYDVMRAADGDIAYPLPWAATPGTSFLETAAKYRRRLGEAGFAVVSETDMGPLALRVWTEGRRRAEVAGPGLEVLMGASTRQRIGNVMKAVEAGLVAPVAMIARAE